jgi:copper homeostasis protein CutC
MAEMDGTPAQRTARLVKAADRRIAKILDKYESSKQTPQQHRTAEAEARGGLIETMVAGGATAKNVAAFQRDLGTVALLMASTSSISEHEHRKTNKEG